MSVRAKCARCQELLEEASSAVIKHLGAQSRLDMARCRHETDVVPALTEVLTEYAVNRADAVNAYKAHRATHPKDLLVPKGLSGIKVRRPIGGQDTKHQPHQARDAESHHDRHRGNRDSDIGEEGDT